MFQALAVRSVWLMLLTCASLSGLAAAESELVDIKLTQENYSSLRDHILPAATDLGWQQIPWLTTFQDGILDANQRQRPLLFWTMNGHPLGCT